MQEEMGGGGGVNVQCSVGSWAEAQNLFIWLLISGCTALATTK